MTIATRSGDPLVRWQPSEGAFTGRYLEQLMRVQQLERDSLELLVSESLDILGSCSDPSDVRAARSGLVIGQVQSGKTLSFTTVSALAHDNGYRLFIVLAGTKTNLRKQSADRLGRDLVFEGRHSHDWHLVDNPADADLERVARILVDRVERPAEEHRSVVLNVLKHSTNIDRISSLLERLDLTEVPTLIIDDEADQASLNTSAWDNVKRGAPIDDDASATFDSIRRLRGSLPIHTLLQYTATPYALLLLDRDDALSPDWARYVTPGRAYTGGSTFFIENADDLVRVLDADETFDKNAPPIRVPAGLRSALESFVLGCAATFAAKVAQPRSMLIQPHGSTDPHRRFADVVTDWCSHLLSLDHDDLMSVFADAYDDLEATQELPALSELVGIVKRIIREETAIRVVNSHQRDKVDYQSGHRFWILIGGFMLDRGFTVEGLTVTYMPRSVGTTNADVLLQRARFYGYRRGYLGLVRVFVPDELRRTLTKLVHSDETLRYNLLDLADRSLRDWRRELDRPRETVRLARKNVASLMTTESASTADWIWPRYLDRSSDINRDEFQRFVDRLRATRKARSHADLPGVVEERPTPPPHEWFEAAPSWMVDDFLDGLEIVVEDAKVWTQIRQAVAMDRPIDVVVLDSLTADRALRGRELEVLRANPFVGRNLAGATHAYSGERDLHGPIDSVTLQLRRVRLRDGSEVDWLTVRRPQSSTPKIVEILTS